MKINRVFIIPYANVNGVKKTISMKTEFGTKLALGMSPNVNEVYLIEGRTHLENYNPFHKRISELVEKIKEKTLSEIKKNIEAFSINYKYCTTRLIPQKE